MALPLDDTDFIDHDVQHARAARGLTSVNPAAPPTVASAIAPRPPTREELVAKVGETQHQIADLKRAQEELERERSALEEARRRRAEFETGRMETIEHLTRGISLLEKAEFEARRDAEQMAKTLAGFRTVLGHVQAIKEETWTLENWNTELTRALTAVENARMEWNAARLKWSLLNGDSVPRSETAAPPAGQVALDVLSGRSFGEWCRLGLALTWPLAAVALVAFATLLLVLWRR